jgi:glycine cleavage system H protein
VRVIPDDLRYTDAHEWVRDAAEGVVRIGITDYAQSQLGDVVFVEVPETGTKLVKGQEAAVVESVKAASDVFAPISGEVIEANTTLEEDPALINADAEGEGWFFKMTVGDPGELDGLMDEATYGDFIAELD